MNPVFRCVFLSAVLLTACTLFGSTENEQTDEFASTSAVKKTDWGSFSMLGEVGNRNLRGSLTYGARFSSTTRFKVSGEYLTQKLHYHFKSGHRDQWSHQYAVGGVFQAIITKSALQSIDLAAAYSHAFGHALSPKATGNQIFKRHIAGSDGALTSASATFSLWKCAYLSLAANYDYIKFHRKFLSPRAIEGAGGSASFVQNFARDYTLTLETEIRRPFNYFGGMLNWHRQFNWCSINLGAYVNYTNGKSGVPDITTGGVQFGLNFGGRKRECPRINRDNDICYSRQYCELDQWVSTPAVRVPTVLATAVSCTNLPTFTVHASSIFFGNPGQTVSITFTDTSPPSVGPVTFTTSSSDTNIATVTQPSGGSFSVTSVNAGTAVITVTATSKCGSVTYTLGVTVQAD